MAGSILALGILLWLTLAVAVGFHAKGYNRSGIIWFIIVGITGIFGFAFYLLAITSKKSKISSNKKSVDRKIITYTPLVILGFIGGLLISFGVLAIGHYTTSYIGRPEPFYPLMLLCGIIGAGGGPYIFSEIRRS